MNEEFNDVEYHKLFAERRSRKPLLYITMALIIGISTVYFLKVREAKSPNLKIVTDSTILIKSVDNTQDHYTKYTNYRYNFSLYYPDRLVKIGPESDMDDGRIFKSDDGNFILSAIYEAFDGDKRHGNLEEAFKYFKMHYDNILDFEHYEKDYFLLVGHDHNIVYTQKFINKDGQVCSCTIQYPYKKVKEYQKYTNIIMASFR